MRLGVMPNVDSEKQSPTENGEKKQQNHQNRHILRSGLIVFDGFAGQRREPVTHMLVLPLGPVP